MGRAPPRCSCHTNAAAEVEGWQSAEVPRSQAGVLHGGVPWMLRGSWVAVVFRVLDCWV
jgi:hypothetical protein